MKFSFSWKIVIKSIVLTTLIMISYFMGRGLSSILHMPEQNIGGMWCAISAIVVFDDLRENVKVLFKNRLLGTLIGSILAVVGIYLIHDLILAITVSLILVSICIGLFNLDGALKIACTTVVIVSISTHGAQFEEIGLTALIRFMESVLGGLMSLSATVLVDHSKYFAKGPQEDI
jgi:uncharacterized membrane protein YccC